MADLVRLLPPAALAVGCILISGAREQLTVQPARPMQTVKVDAPGYTATDLVVKPEEKRVAGFDDYMVRAYQRDSLDPGFSSTSASGGSRSRASRRTRRRTASRGAAGSR
jgi:hypothetical protein